MWNTESKRPKYRLQPDHFLIGILVAQGGLLVADRFYLCGLTRGDLWNVQLAAGLVGGVVSIGLLWLFAGQGLNRPFCQGLSAELPIDSDTMSGYRYSCIVGRRT